MDVLIRPVASGDVVAVRSLLRRVAIFQPHEIDVAEELLADSLSGGTDYVVHVAENRDGPHHEPGAGPVLGYVCHGHNPVTDALHDVYWIAVDPAAQGRGVGRALLAHAESCVRRGDGRGLVIDTSSRNEYAPARRLYERCGYQRVARVPDYYRPGDALIVYMKLL